MRVHGATPAMRSFVQVIEQASVLGQAFLAALLLEDRYSNKRECALPAIATRVSSFWRSRPPPHLLGDASTAPASASGGQLRRGLLGASAASGPGPLTAAADALPAAALLMVVRELEACKLVAVVNRAYNWGCAVKLLVPEDDVAHVLKQEETSKIGWLHDQLRAAV